jgi:nucleoside-diphosphate-sugar epimerase
MNKALVCGGGGFIGSHVVKRLKHDGWWVRAVDLKRPQYSESAADEFVIGDLRDQTLCRSMIDQDFDEVYQLAADMGGADYIFTGTNDAEIMLNSATVNLNVLAACRTRNIGSFFFPSAACIYPLRNQINPDHPICSEESA